MAVSCNQRHTYHKSNPTLSYLAKTNENMCTLKILCTDVYSSINHKSKTENGLHVHELVNSNMLTKWNTTHQNKMKLSTTEYLQRDEFQLFYAK
jgi:hypothetical protein